MAWHHLANFGSLRSYRIIYSIPTGTCRIIEMLVNQEKIR